MKKIFLLLFLFVSILSFSQKVTNIIDCDIYKSYFDNNLKVPLYVTYKIYKGGGTCSRNGFHFINDSKLNTASIKDYSHSGYDIGHLANSQDFAYDCTLDEKTFRFYNTIPQTPNLNRGIWKHYETLIRNLSQKDSLFIICGGIYTTKKTIGNGINVPNKCFKIVKNLKTNKIVYILLFNNTTKADVLNIKETDIIKYIPYELPKK